MLRAIILSLVLFIAFGTIAEMATENTEATSVIQKKRKYKKKQRAKRYRKYRSTRSRKSRKSSRKRVAKRYKKSSRRRVARKYRQPKRRKSVRRYKKRTTRYRKTRRYTAKRKVVRKKRARKYSKKWWASYRTKKARQKAIAKRKRSMRLRRIRLAKRKRATRSRTARRNSSYQRNVAAKKQSPNKADANNNALAGWVQNEATDKQLSFEVDGGNGSAALTVLGPASGASTSGWRNDTVGGVSTTVLRRTVIDQMMRENGWVENDFQKEIAGKKVYVVVAKSPDVGNRVQSRTFYFTEANGRIYSLATKANKEETEKIVKQSEKVIESLQEKSSRPQQAKN